jgi:hypothetical protein
MILFCNITKKSTGMAEHVMLSFTGNYMRKICILVIKFRIMSVFSCCGRNWSRLLLVYGFGSILLVSCNSGNKVVSTFGKRKYTKGFYSFKPAKLKEGKQDKEFAGNPAGKISHAEGKKTAPSIITMVRDKSIVKERTFFSSIAKTMNKAIELGSPMLLMENLTRKSIFGPDTNSDFDSQKKKNEKAKKIAQPIMITAGVALLIIACKLNSIPTTGYLLILGILLILVGFSLTAKNKQPIYHPNADTPRDYDGGSPDISSKLKKTNSAGGALLIVLGLIGLVASGFFTLITVALGSSPLEGVVFIAISLALLIGGIVEVSK